MNVRPLLRLLFADVQGPSAARAAPRAQPVAPPSRRVEQEGVQMPGSALRWRLEDGRERLGGAVRTLDPKLVPVGEPAPPSPARRAPDRHRAVALSVLALTAVVLGAAGIVAFLLHEPSPAPSPAAPAVTAAPAAAPPAPSPNPGNPVDLTAVQRRLTELSYYVGPLDGQASPSLRAAIIAFQKVHDLPVDGVLRADTQAALAAPRAPGLLGGEDDRVEVDLTRQVLYLVDDERLVRILPVSSGNGLPYQTADGTIAQGLTPVGEYRVQLRVSGDRPVSVGTLHDPLYFYRGWAIYGSDAVPTVPASHGSVRVTRADGVWLNERVEVGTQVVLHGGQHTFPAGSDAAGTDEPGGDTPTDTIPELLPPIIGP